MLLRLERGVFYPQVPTHAKMNEEGERRQLEDQELAPTTDIQDLLSLDLPLEAENGRRGNRATPTDLSAGYGRANQVGPQQAGIGFNFG